MNLFHAVGGGSFTGLASFTLPERAVTGVVADLTGDSNPDVVFLTDSLAGISSSDPPVCALYLYAGDGHGGIQWRGSRPIGCGAASFTPLAIDVNGDGILDLLTGDGSTTLALFIGTGNGQLSGPRPIPVGLMPSSAAFADSTAMASGTSPSSITMTIRSRCSAAMATEPSRSRGRCRPEMRRWAFQ